MLGIKLIGWSCMTFIFALTACDRSESAPKDSASAQPPKVRSAQPEEPSAIKLPPAETKVDGPVAPSAPKAPPRVALEIGLGEESWGKIVLELDEQKAPATVKNFLRYVDEGFYTDTIFHRVIPNFMIQGGGFTNPTDQKTAGLHEPIQNEAKNGLKNKLGTIAMARTGDPHSASSQFFINVNDNGSLDYPSPDGWGYCVFGKVVEGMDVVDRIKNVETTNNPGMREKSLPISPPVLKKAYRVKAS